MMSNTTCPSIAQYPLRVREAAGGFVGGKPLICGGWDMATESPTSACYSHDPATNVWIPHMSLHTARYRHASVNMGDALWLTGGKDLKNLLSSSTFVYGNVLITFYLIISF